jgi:hypothetical protein
MGWSPWLVLLLVIPVANLVMQLLLLIIPAKTMPYFGSLGIMDAPPITRGKLGTKVWEFVFGSLLIGGAPLVTYWLLAMLSDWHCDLVFKHYGNRPAFILQMIALGIATLAAMAAFGLAIFWRTRHRVLPVSLLAFEIVVAIVWAFCLMFFIALLIGPNDAWNQ